MRILNIQPYIRYEDKDILVCYKPAGLAVQSARMGQMDLESLLKNYEVSKNPGQMPFVGVVHRLDQPVEGLLVFGKNRKAAAKLNQSLAQEGLGKKYLAVVHGTVNEKGRLEDYLKKDARQNASFVVEEGTPQSKKAVLRYAPLKIKDSMTLVEIEIDTGRHHQIRVQMSHAGMPLAGDHKYGKEDDVDTVALCAHKIAFPHPVTGKKMKFEIRPQGVVFQSFLQMKHKKGETLS